MNNSENYHSSTKISPDSFHHAIGVFNPQFETIDANDSKDLLLFLFQAMHEELNYFGNKKLQVVPKCNQTNLQDALDFFMKVNKDLNLSIFSYLFYGIFKSETECLTCHIKYYNFQYFQIISFPLYEYKSKAKFNIYQGFKDFVKKAEMRGDNQCYCQNCKKLRDSDVSSQIYYTPPYLIINLDYGKNKKYVPKEINFGDSLDLTGFTVDNCTQRSYQLIAISSHIGRSGISGHYIAYCKNQSNKDNNWYEFNDSSISKIEFEKINQYSPYVLIFKRIDNSF
jgi:ubiquitin C-terminal hydrolase